MKGVRMSVISTSYQHQPVMLQRCLDLLRPGIEGHTTPVFIDCTLGLGGHSEALLKAFPKLRVIGIDRDRQALKRSSARLVNYSDRFIAIHGTYDQIDKIATKYGDSSGKVQGILMDLGVSSMQLDDDSRGFTYARDTALDMRMDQSKGNTAAELLEWASETEIREILYRYGEEKFAPKIAKLIVETRQEKAINTTGELVQIIKAAIPAAARRQGGNPAKRSFQALRVAVNNELNILEKAICAAISVLAPQATLVVESYQSLEDKIVKQAFKNAVDPMGKMGIPHLDVASKTVYQVLSNRAVKANEEEIENNSRAKSVRLRAITCVALDGSTIVKKPKKDEE